MSDKKTFVKEIHDTSIKDLVKMRNKLRKELFAQKMLHASKGAKQTHTLQATRKNIARINTVLASKIKQAYGNRMK